MDTQDEHRVMPFLVREVTLPLALGALTNGGLYFMEWSNFFLKLLLRSRLLISDYERKMLEFKLHGFDFKGRHPIKGDLFVGGWWAIIVTVGVPTWLRTSAFEITTILACKIVYDLRKDRNFGNNDEPDWKLEVSFSCPGLGKLLGSTWKFGPQPASLERLLLLLRTIWMLPSLRSETSTCFSQTYISHNETIEILIFSSHVVLHLNSVVRWTYVYHDGSGAFFKRLDSPTSRNL